MNLFEQAIEKKELLQFAIGSGEYFIADRDYGEHSVINSWISYILPLVESKGIQYVTEKIEEMFQNILYSDLNPEVKNENLLYHLHVYYYLDSDGRIKADKLTPLNPEMRSLLIGYLEELTQNNNPKENAVRNALNLIISRGGLAATPI